MMISRDRLLATHVGSLPRNEMLSDLLVRREEGEEVDKQRLSHEMDRAVQPFDQMANRRLTRPITPVKRIGQAPLLRGGLGCHHRLDKLLAAGVAGNVGLNWPPVAEH